MGGVAYNLQQFFYTKVSRIDRLTTIHVNDNLGNNKPLNPPYSQEVIHGFTFKIERG